jgi:hypothetical protein
LDCADGGPLPLPFEAVTVNVYVVPFVSPVTVSLVGAGEPETVVVGCAVDPMKGVMTYEVTAPPELGALQLSPAEALPAVATTLVGCPGDVAGEKTTSTQ